MDENKNPLKDSLDKSAIGLAVKLIREVWEKNRKLIYIDLIITAVIAIAVSGYVYEQSQLLTRAVRYFSWSGAIAGALTKFFLFTLILFLLQNYLVYRLTAAFHKETARDSERNYDASHEGYYGTAREMTPEERDEVFISGDYFELKDIIIGADKDNIMKMYSLDTTVYGINRNIIIFGAPGSGKSRCYGIPILMQKIRMGESCIVTDPKGELYRETAAMAMAHGCIVKILNFKPENMLHSDTCDYMSVIGSKTYVAQSFSKTVIDNTNDGKVSDFWTDSEFNLLIGLSLLITTGDGFMGMPKNLASAYNILNTNTVDSFEEMASCIPDIHPAKPFLNTWANGDKTVKGNTFAGLQIRLSSLAMPIVQRLCSTPDIDLTLPGKQQCIYYIGSSDTDKSMSYLVALFITLLCNALVSLADSTDEGYLPVRVTLLLDELANIGRIPDYTEKLSTFRGRHIDIISILQDLGQLQKMYPDNEWDTILNDCHVKIVLRANNKTTSDYFSDLSGPQTIEDKGKRYIEKAGQLIKAHTEYQITESHSERPLYTPHEIRTLDKKCVLVFVSGENCIKMQKIDYSNHPMCKELRKWPATKHAPKWILDMPESERIEFGVYNEKYRREYFDDIELCTEEDFKHPWTPEDQERLKKYIEEYAKERESKKKKAKGKETPKKNNTSVTVQKENTSGQIQTDNRQAVPDHGTVSGKGGRISDLSAELALDAATEGTTTAIGKEIRQIKNGMQANAPAEREVSMQQDMSNAKHIYGVTRHSAATSDTPQENSKVQNRPEQSQQKNHGYQLKTPDVSKDPAAVNTSDDAGQKDPETEWDDLSRAGESPKTEKPETGKWSKWVNEDEAQIKAKSEAAEKETDDETENELLPDIGDIPDIETPDFSGFDDLGFSDDDLMMDEGMEGDEYY